MEAIRLFKALTRDQRHTFIACFLGWALDALDFFLLTFVFLAVAQEFGKTVPEVAFASMLTLMFRPLGALLFGFLGDRFGRRIPLMVDMNCPSDGTEAIAFAQACRAATPMFIEEPVWPPEDFATLAEVRAKGGLAIAAGENACTVHQFRQMMTAGAVSYAQPSVIKVGGITEYLKVAALADEMGIRLAPHSPYYGPGLLATLQLMSLRDDGSFIEIFYMNRAACLWHGQIDADANGRLAVPEGPGLGYEPDRETMERYRVS